MAERLAKGWRKVGEGLAKGWRKVGEGLAKGWRAVGEGLAEFLAPSIFGEFQGTKIQPKVFLTEVFGNLLGSWTSAPSGHGCPRRNTCFFFQDFDRPGRSSWPGYPLK